MSFDRSLFAIYLCAISSAPASGCMCFSAPMCSEVASLSQANAVFVGRVVEVWPPRGVLARQERLSPRQLKELVLRRWQSTLSDEEVKDIRTSAEQGNIDLRYAYMLRIRFVVSESFSGPSIREIYTDSSSCGYRFELGITYLGFRFRTGACSRTARVDSEDAAEDIKALRAWKSGTPLAPRIYGRITQTAHHGNVRVRLRGGHGDVRAPIDASGGFSFDGLEKAPYQLEIEDSRGTGSEFIDLSHSACFEVTPWFSDGWHLGVSPTVMRAKTLPVIEMPDPPPFDPGWIPKPHP